MKSSLVGQSVVIREFIELAQVNESFQQPGRWHDVTLPGVAGVQGAPGVAGAPGVPGAQGGLTHRVTHELRGLRPSAIYEVIVQAKNRYGWNEVRT